MALLEKRVNGTTVNVNVRTPMFPALSCAWSLKLCAPTANGGPANSGVPGACPLGSESPDSSANPFGNGPSSVIVYGGVPPVGVTLDESENPCWKVPRLGPLTKLSVVVVGPLMLN